MPDGQPAARTPVVRNYRFDLEGEQKVPRYWHGGRRALTLFFNNLSIFFPAGERFFIASVRAHRDRIKDPQLGEAVRAFCAQEGVHSREHIRYNEMLREQGFPVEEMEQRVVRLLRRVAKVTPPRWQLAVTCALEHFTALLAYFVLSDPRYLAGAHPTMARLWRWHAAEESEHRAVAFDVYKQSGGGYFERCLVMLLVTLHFWGRVILQQVRLMRADGLLWNWREWGALLRFLFIEPGGVPQLAFRYLSYYRPGFHPLHIDSDGLVASWQAEAQSAQEGHPAPLLPPA